MRTFAVPIRVETIDDRLKDRRRTAELDGRRQDQQVRTLEQGVYLPHIVVYDATAVLPASQTAVAVTDIHVIRTQGFMPGASPPLVSTPILFTLMMLTS